MGKRKQEVKNRENVNQFILNKIPFVNCYSELGMIETKPGVFTRSYEITAPAGEPAELFDVRKVRAGMENILKTMVPKFTCQMFVRNSDIPIDTYLDSVLLESRDDEVLDPIIEEYNDVIENSVGIGHNNFKRTVYFVVSTKADTADKAYQKFKNADHEIQKAFEEIYGYTAVAQSIEERLALIRQMFNPGERTTAENIRERIEKKGKNDSVKQVVCPSHFVWKNRDYLEVGDKFVRVLFLNSVPSIVSDSILNDLMAVSSNAALSIIYEPLDSELGAKVAKELVDANTSVKKVQLRDTIEERKLRKTKETREIIHETETEYFHQEANEVFRKARENNEEVILATIIIALYADDMEQLDRDTKMLRISAVKYASQVRVCDLMQDKAFQGVLPLAQSNINVYRTFTSAQLAIIQPIDVHELFDTTKAFHGLNGISDNLVMIDRSNYMAGMICGVEHSGKSFAVKREAANILMTTDDEVIILSNRIKPYARFVREFGGELTDNWKPDIFAIDNSELRSIFLSAYCFYKEDYLHSNFLEDELEQVTAEIKREVGELESISDLDGFRRKMVTDALNSSVVNKAFSNYDVEERSIGNDRRLHVLAADENTKFMTMLLSAVDYAEKHRDRRIWLFVDSVDFMLYSQIGSDFLVSAMKRMETLNNPVTLVIQDSVHLITNPAAVIEYDYLLTQLTYYKLLNQGPVERRYYVDKLNIPESLVAYVTDKEPGEGIIITPSANIAINDRFEADHPFYKHFAE